MKKNQIGSNSDILVVQHNNLIEAKYNTTLQEKRLILWLMSRIKREDKEFLKYKVNIREFAKTIGIQNNHNLYAEIRKVTHSLLRKIITIHIPEKKQLIQATFFSSAIYQYGEGTIEFSFDPALKPFLLELNQQFTTLSLQYALKLSSAYAIRIYELLKQYFFVGSRKVSLEELREYLGIGKDKYQLYSSLKAKVLSIAEKEINTKTDISLECKEIKEGKKVVALDFIINKNSIQAASYNVELKITESAEIKEQRDLKTLLHSNYGLSISQTGRLLALKNSEEIRLALKYVDKYSDSNKVSNLAGFTYKAVEEGWGLNEPQVTKDIIKEEQKDKVLQIIENVDIELWRKILRKLYLIKGKSITASWFLKLKFRELKSENESLILEASSNFFRDYITNNYLPDLLKAAKDEYIFINNVVIEVNSKE